MEVLRRVVRETTMDGTSKPIAARRKLEDIRQAV
jgi:hypothetical protein